MATEQLMESTSNVMRYNEGDRKFYYQNIPWAKSATWSVVNNNTRGLHRVAVTSLVNRGQSSRLDRDKLLLSLENIRDTCRHDTTVDEHMGSSTSDSTRSRLLGRFPITICKDQCKILMRQILNLLEDFAKNAPPGITSTHPGLQLWPKPALRELYRVLMKGMNLIKTCCIEPESCLKSALKHDRRAQAFGEVVREIQLCKSMLYICDSIETQCMDVQKKFTDLLKKAANNELKKIMVELENWRHEFCSSKVCGKRYREPEMGPNYCLVAQILGKWEKTKLGSLGGTADASPSASEVDDHKSLLWSFENCKEVVELVRMLGTGACGVVLQVQWLGDEYAHKIFHSHGLSSLPVEAKTLAKLNHPHIIKLFAYSQDSILMELMSTDLYKYIGNRRTQGASQPFSLPAAVDLMLQIAGGMRYLHSQGMAHRDLKSGNILVKSAGNEQHTLDADGFLYAKIADFGMAKTKREITSYSHLTHNIGTKLWMAPEIFEENKYDVHLDKAFPMKADVYSYGIICFEILSGEEPFQGVKRCELYKMLTAQPFPLRPQLPSTCPRNLASLIQRCWDADPRRRPTFADVCRALTCLKGHLIADMDEMQLGDVQILRAEGNEFS